jgi:hypothetical protein
MQTGMICGIREYHDGVILRRPLPESDGETVVYLDQLEANHGSIFE